MLWVTAPDGRLAFISHGWCEHTGQSEAEALGEDGFGWLEAVHAEDRDEVWRVLSAANDRQEPFSLDYRLRHRGGESEYRWAIVAGRPRVGEGGEFLGFVGSVIDVHERKQSEQALREAARRKDEFLATLSHELRGPLAPLRNTIEIMKRAGDDRDVIDGARSTIDRQVTQLVRLVDDLLDVSRITRNKLELRREPVELGPIVELAIESCRPLLEELEHDLEVILPSELLTLHADPARVTQILSNLLHNACKYTERGGRIRLSAEGRGGEVVMVVSDTGIGIPRDQLDSVFEMFTQGDPSSERLHSGLGIGLTLVRQLVEMHGGTVEASSEGLGRGSEFVVRLPLSGEQREAPRRESGEAGTNGTASRRILVVDDNPDTAGSLAELLRITGHDADVAYDGLEAVVAAERIRPDVILLDLGLPKLNGIDAARRIRERAWAGKVLLVALTGWGSDEDRRKTREAGFDHHLVKPLDYDVLIRVIAGRCDSETPVGT
ncbi:MAG TPA: ATP-binding protein [Thermoanaerobaculia bacterium]|nr:ATP-binding protein [Thermoanaerobaculia bacterium]